MSDKKRRPRGDGGLHWDSKRQRWIASVTVGYTPAGKRIVRKASDRSKTKALAKLKEKLRDVADGLPSEPGNYTVAEAVRYWLTYGLNGRDAETVANYRTLAEKHIIPALGARKLRELNAEDVDKWLAEKATALSTRTLRLLHSILNRAVRRAQAQDKVKRNVVALCDIPTGRQGRPSKALTFTQAEAVLNAAEGAPLYAYIVLSLLVGARTEELRALTWNHVDLDGALDAEPPIPPSVKVWRSVRAGGDTKTRKSRRTLALPARCVEALRAHRAAQDVSRKAAGAAWQEHGLVFASRLGTPLDSHNVRRAFRRIVAAAGLPAREWTPREMRHSFVSLLSDHGVAIEDIARLCGHSGTGVTETVYRLQIRPVIDSGAIAMDRIFPRMDPPA
ncbi:site-specific integrase [Actinomadura montaniterrae]|uniref:Site-specific integrase n=1 Tax=Actinomadura montaniterrae TaxID=1803903 RepID=A0A6L3VFI3_9ACTN|nr:site-specific integrase [Actinomadura montaniterrae]KAB2365212.1 site-specific integrase [Actinomadura montaniterrae]